MKFVSALLLCIAPLAASQTADIPGTAVAAGTFETLVAALTAADLVGAVSDPNGPFTVFAPSDEAFAALPEGLVECLVKPENKDTLSAVLTYHVASGQVLSTDLTEGMIVTTLNTATLTVDLTEGVKINTATVTAADVLATNGVIHVIDAVLVPADFDVSAFLATCMPPPPPPPMDKMDIPATAIAAETFGTLVAALGAADLVTALSEPNGPFTVFAPNDDAFAALPEDLVPCLLQEENISVLDTILKYHVVSGKVMSTDLTDGMTAPTLSGSDITVDLTDGVKIDSSTVITADIEASNGVIHVVDAVLVPSGTDVTAFLEGCTVAPAPAPAPDAETEETSGAFGFNKVVALTIAAGATLFM